jgi:hypothetical protein
MTVGTSTAADWSRRIDRVMWRRRDSFLVISCHRLAATAAAWLFIRCTKNQPLKRRRDRIDTPHSHNASNIGSQGSTRSCGRLAAGLTLIGAPDAREMARDIDILAGAV